jgi:hypothetical protein
MKITTKYHFISIVYCLVLLTGILFYVFEYRPYKTEEFCEEIAAKEVLSDNLSEQSIDLYQNQLDKCVENIGSI